MLQLNSELILQRYITAFTQQIIDITVSWMQSIYLFIYFPYMKLQYTSFTSSTQTCYFEMLSAGKVGIQIPNYGPCL